jgi:DNA-3-methyladenine glycosylase
MNALKPSFYEQDTLQLSKTLLGKLLIHETSAGLISGWIVETEAYIGPIDQAAHSFNNRRTKRTEIMYGAPGFAYIYTMHNHTLLNVVSGKLGNPEAVLIRAIEPVEGIEFMIQSRGEHIHQTNQLTNGPGKLTKALQISNAQYGHPLFTKPLYIAEGKEIKTVSSGPRIGIDNKGEAKFYPWRFWETGNGYVSKKLGSNFENNLFT